MLNLEYFQSLFGQESTEIRCRQVLDEISPAINRLFEGFIEQTGISLGNEYYIRNYDMTLSTTYHDSRNPTNAEKKKNSDIGKKYFVGLYRKVDEKEHNIFTLELNGFSELILIHTDINLLPFWAWVKNESINTVLESIPSPYEIFTGWKEKEIIPKDELVSFVKGCVKSRKRPWFQVGRSLPLEAQIDEDTLVKHLFEVWENLSLFRTYLNDEINTSKRASEALGILASARSIKETELMGREYNLEITSLEGYKSNGKRQAFHLYDSDQLLTKGFLYYFEHHEKFSPFQTIMIQIEGHNHIFTNVREILGQGTKQWWITKSFTTHNLDNHQVMSEAMGLLNGHGIEAKGNEYRVGSFDNESRLFIEGNDQVKKNFIDAALLFAHASRKLELPSEEESGSMEDIDKDTEPEISEDLEPNFRIEEIFQSILDSQFTFSKGIIRDLHLNLTALDDKHFVLLSGISGTGKTQLCRLYANAVYGLEYESENPYFTIIPVRPDWTDASALFGYYSSFEKRYVKTVFLEVILNALKEREKPHFILLDEMNLARVEYYLSDYLSAVESRKEIPLHQDNLITDIPKKLLIPPNVYLLGTINVDETTHTISDKVLDRAFVMTLSDVDFETFWDNADHELKLLLEREFLLLKKLHNILLQFDLHFGYRTMNEMLQKLHANLQFPDEFQMDSLEALDRVISEKVLTKIRGDERVSDMLGKIEEWLKENLFSSSISLQHVERMQKELEYYGATQFWR